ncbi:MAG: hypothetical protein L0Y44_04085 [Phycisphaerales bacterium]|nr:hypothetical protein [Phycisphaerales bacterium]MCI0629817.1 hypothetical protein [Phycisphaerales bacterium]MCI0674698.1 hypothetical protein [Phycisphaerales bacterium]
MPLDPRRIEVMDDQVAAIMRHKTPQEKLAMLDDLWQLAESLTEAGVRELHPDWSDQQVRRERIRRMSRGAL